MTRELIIRALDGQALRASEREQVRQHLDRLDKAAMQATGRPGASRSQTVRRLVVDGDLDVPTGTVTIGPVASGMGNVKLSSGGIQLRSNTTVKIDLQTDGDVFIGEDTAAAATTFLSIFTAAQTYNSESMSAGDVLIGDNSASKANILWDKSAGTLLFRGGTTTQVSVNTSGEIAASGTKMNSRGINIKGAIGVAWGATNSLKLVDGKTGTPNSIGEFAALYTETSLGSDVAATVSVTLSAGTDTVADGDLTIVAYGSGGSITLEATDIIINGDTSSNSPVFANIKSGTWTPTLTNTTNLDGSTAFECFYQRVGSVVGAWGRVNMNPTAGGVVRLGVSLPIASNFGATADCPGVAFCGEVAGQGAMIYADTTNDRAVFEWIAADTTDKQWYFHFGYEII